MKWKVWKIVRKISDEKLVKMLQFWIFLVVDKWQLWFHGKIVEKNFVEKNRENGGILQFLAFDNFDSTEKLSKKIWLKKIVKMVGFCSF